MHFGKCNLLIMPIVFSVFSHSVVAQDAAPLSWTGFATTGFSVSDSETLYLGQVDEDGSFLDTRLGLNVSTQFGPNWQLAGQILMAGREEEFNAHADWVFAKYRFNDNASLLFGKMKYPNLLYSEVFDVGAIYQWARAPEEIYNLGAGGAGVVLEAMEGVSLVLSAFPGDVEYIFQPAYHKPHGKVYENGSRLKWLVVPVFLVTSHIQAYVELFEVVHQMAEF